MNIPQDFKYNQEAKYRVGGVYGQTHQLSLVNQTITINKNNFTARFPNIWINYKLPQIKDPQIYDDWISNPMQFWQNQLNFAVWCATTGCGVSKTHLRNKDPMIRSVFRFHVYYQIRRILTEMQCPLPTDESFSALNNGINLNAFGRICSEFSISPNADFRQKLDPSQGMGAIRYYTTHKKYTHHHMRFTTEKVLEKGGDYDPESNFTVYIPSSGKFGSGPSHTYKIEYIEQYFNDKTPMDAIGSFVLDKSKGFTQAGIARINDSIRTYVWAILGAQSQTKSSILGTGKAFDAQKQFLSNVEDAINSEIDLPSSIDRYQSTLKYSRSKVDYVIGLGLYMIPSDMDLYIGTINGYNNLIVIASSDLQLGHNNEVNEEQPIPQETFESPPDDFEPSARPPEETVQPPEETTQPPDDFEPPTSEDIVQPPKETVQPLAQDEKKLTHDENKLLITLGGITIGSLIWFSK